MEQSLFLLLLYYQIAYAKYCPGEIVKEFIFNQWIKNT